MGAHVRLTLATLPFIAWSAWRPYDRATWWLEVSPALAGLVLLLAVRERFVLSRVALVAVFVHILILLVGGHYTYARVPAFEWLREALDLQRNHYDRVGHLAQGFVPALLAREVLLRLDVLARGRWLPFLVVSICLAISAFYELLEWWVALLSEEAAEAFLGTQGDEWDTQADMALALAGAVLALALFSRAHDRSLARRLGEAPPTRD